MGDGALPPPGFPIRVSTDQSLLAAPRGLSQPAAPFVGSLRLGIHQAPYVAWSPLGRQNCSFTRWTRKNLRKTYL